jgi:tripartite-type tricarboxylate transporter receptor subunit TctC
MLNMPRRRFIQIVASAAALPAASRIAMGATYPTQPVTLIVFVPAGGYPDIAARLVGQSLSRRLGQGVIIENRPGAGGNIALEAVARAAQDGYTLLLAATPHAVNATLYQEAKLNVARDVAAVAGIAHNPLLMIVAPSLPVRTLPEFIAYAKANPGKLNMTSSGTGNLTHLAAQLFKMMTGVDMLHVPSRGAAGAHTGLITGELHVMFDGIGSALPQVQSSKLRALAVTAATRWQELPDIPTVAEFVPNYVVDGWLGVAAPRGTPPEIIDRLNKEINEVLAEPEIKARLRGFGAEPLSGSPAEFGKYIMDDTDKWAKVIRATNIKPQ